MKDSTKKKDLTGLTVEEKDTLKKGRIVEQQNQYIYIHFDDGTIKKYVMGKEVSEHFNFFYNLKKCNTEVRNYMDKWIKYLNKHKEQNKKKKRSTYSIHQVKWNSLNQKPDLMRMPEFIEQFKNLLDQEIYLANKKYTSSIILKNGIIIKNSSDEYVYMFDIKDEFSLIPESQVTVIKQSSLIKGKVDSILNESVILSFESPLERIDRVEIKADTTFLIKTIQKRLYELNKYNNPISFELVEMNKKALINNFEKPEKKIEDGYKNQSISMLWGPPGTGKTETIKNIAVDCWQRKKKVLILSHTNAAIDEAAIRIYEKGDLTLNKKSYWDRLIYGKYSIGRFGYTKNDRIEGNPELSIYERVKQEYPELYRLQEAVQNQIFVFRQFEKELNKEVDDLSEEEKEFLEIIKDRIADLKQQQATIKTQINMRQEMEALKCQILLTTISQALTRDVFFRNKWDTVIVDEVSICYIPQIVLCAGLSANHFVCVGDFLQLPPITQQNNTLLTRDIFWFCRITEAVAEHKSHDWLYMLQKQWRMPAQITDFLTKTFYENNLKIVNKKSGDNVPIILADSSNPFNFSISNAEGSKMNVGNALTIMSLIMIINYKTLKDPKKSVGIITPYRNQTRLYSSLIKDLSIEFPDLRNISVSTVHKFQGSEKHTVYYDLVDNPQVTATGKRNISRMHRNIENDSANRLFNVALSRTKEQFILLGNLKLFEEKMSDDLLLYQMIRTITPSKYKIDGFRNNLSVQSAKEEFIKLLKEAKDRIILSMPYIGNDDVFLQRVKMGLYAAMHNKVDIKIWIPENMKMAFHKKYFSNLESWCFYGAQKEILPIAIIDDVMWYPNPLVFKEHEDNILCTMLQAPETIDTIINESVLSCETYQYTNGNEKFALYVKENVQCTKCFRKMELKPGWNGRAPYLHCPACGENESVSRQILEEYLYNNGQGITCSQHDSKIVLEDSKGLKMKCTDEDHEHPVMIKQI